MREERACTGLHSYTPFHTLWHKSSLLQTAAKFLGSAPVVALPSITPARVGVDRQRCLNDSRYNIGVLLGVYTEMLQVSNFIWQTCK
jgi:hypothetical protein